MLDRTWMCDLCGYVMDRVSSASGKKAIPEDDDCTVCMNCGTIYLKRGQRWILATKAQIALFPPRVKKTLAIMEQVRKSTITVDLVKKTGRRH